MLKKLLKNKLVLLLGGGALLYYLYKKKQDQSYAPISIQLPPGAPGTQGVGAYVTKEMLSGMGYDVDSGANAFGAVSRADVAYDDTFDATQ